MNVSKSTRAAISKCSVSSAKKENIKSLSNHQHFKNRRFVLPKIYVVAIGDFMCKLDMKILISQSL